MFNAAGFVRSHDTSRSSNAVASNYGSLQLLMNGASKFDIDMDEILFILPIQANKRLANAIKHTEEIKIMIQENEFDENSWKILSQGIISRKYINSHFVLQIQYTKISSANVHYFCNTITQSWTKELILHDLIFEADTFDVFCSRISKISYIQSFKMSINNLTKEQIDRVKKILESKLGAKKVILYEAKEIIARSTQHIAELIKGVNAFSIHSLEVLTLNDIIKPSPRLCRAIKRSSSLKKIILTDYYPDSELWCNLWLIDALSTNTSITDFRLASEGPRFQQIMDIIIAVVNKNRIIVNLEVSDLLDITAEKAGSIHQLLTTTRSIKNLKISAPYIHLATYNAISEAQYLNSLSITTTEWPSLPQHVLAITRSIAHIPNLTIRKGQIRPIVIELDLRSVKILKLKDASELTGGMKTFSTKVKESKILEALSLTGCFNITGMKKFRRIYKFSENLRKINFKSSPFDSADLTKFITGLKKNKTLTSVYFVLNTDCIDQLASLLKENSTLIHLGLVFDDEPQENRRSIRLALSYNNTLRSLSVTATQGLCGKILRKNNSVDKFKLSCHFENSDNIRRFWKDIKIVLHHNKVLDNVILITDVQGAGADVETDRMLESNYTTKKQARMNMTLFIRIMAARAQIYLSVLPLELWLNIFRQVSIPGVHLNFSKILLDSFKKCK